jgi:hypothetical protein
MSSRAELGAIVEQYCRRIIPGTPTTKRRERLRELLAETRDPDAIELYRTWHGGEVQTEADVANRTANAGAGGNGFDPAEDQAYNNTRARVANAYDAALEQGLDEEAAYLRELPHEHQQEFASLLTAEYLDRGE